MRQKNRSVYPALLLAVLLVVVPVFSASAAPPLHVLAATHAILQISAHVQQEVTFWANVRSRHSSIGPGLPSGACEREARARAAPCREDQSFFSTSPWFVAGVVSRGQARFSAKGVDLMRATGAYEMHPVKIALATPNAKATFPERIDVLANTLNKNGSELAARLFNVGPNDPLSHVGIGMKMGGVQLKWVQTL